MTSMFSSRSFSVMVALVIAVVIPMTARSAEIHAVWDHTGSGLYPGNWPKTMQVLKAAHVTDLFVNVAGADFAHYASSILPRSKTFERNGDQMVACLNAARGTGIRVHAWVICFNATRGVPRMLEMFRKRGWRLRNKDGSLSTYLNPANPNVRTYVLSIVDELQMRYPLHGIHLDFVRWGDAAVKPQNAAAVMTQFVAEARRHVKRPRLLTTAVYGKYPNCIASVGQDWVRWLNLDLVDFIAPMDYTESTAKFIELLQQQSTPRINARRTIIGIGVTANESKLTAAKVIHQIDIARKYGFAGQALFRLDFTLENKTFPALRKGVW